MSTVVYERRSRMDNLMWVVGLFTGLAVGALVGVAITENDMRSRAIEANVAEYGVDAKTGDVKFTFKKMGE